MALGMVMSNIVNTLGYYLRYYLSRNNPTDEIMPFLKERLYLLD